MASNILLPTEFQIDNVSFTDPRKNNMGGQNVLINYAGNDKSSPLVFQTPRLRCPFGLDTRESDQGGPPKYNVNVSLAHGDKPHPGLLNFTENIRCIDQFIKDKGVENAEQWFGKAKSMEVIEELFRPCEKHAKEKEKWPSTLKLKLPYKDGKPSFDVYNEKKEQINLVNADGELDLECIQRGCEVVAIIQCTGIWFIGKTQFGIGWKVLQMKLYQTNKLVGYSIVDDDDDPKEENDADDEQQEEEVTV